MNTEQSNSLAALQALLLANRGISEPLQTIVDGNAILTLVNGAMVRIGRKGGFGLPEVRSYPETQEIGKRAIDAACNADLLLARQVARGSKYTVAAPTVPVVLTVPAFTGFDAVPAVPATPDPFVTALESSEPTVDPIEALLSEV